MQKSPSLRWVSLLASQRCEAEEDTVADVWAKGMVWLFAGTQH